MLREETSIVCALGYVLFSILYLGSCLQFDKDLLFCKYHYHFPLCAYMQEGKRRETTDHYANPSSHVGHHATPVHVSTNFQHLTHYLWREGVGLWRLER
jgi:hypothetical protein